MNVYEVFPIVVIQDKVECHTEFKSSYFEELKSLWFNGYENETPENSGRCSLHLNKKYHLFFSNLKNNIVKYLNLLEINTEKIDINIMKSWVGYHNKDIPPLNPHVHNGSDISFCYYLSCDETSDKLCLHNLNNINEVSGNIFETSDRYNLIKKFNKYNCPNYVITPVEGNVILFPSKLSHSTIKNKNLGDRYVIAGDIKLCLKPEYNLHHQSIPHPSRWIAI